MLQMNRKIFVILFSWFFLFQTLAVAQDARLVNINISNTRDDLLIYFNVEGAFREKLEKAVLSGAPATFSFYVNLYRVRNFWPDKNIADIKVTHTVKYDTLKKEFTVTRPWKKSKPVVTKSFQQAQKLMTEIDSLNVVSLNNLEKGRRYQTRAKAEVSKLTLPFYLHYVLFFVSLWDFETDWYTIDFIY
jgi:hypothetical protein